MSAPAQNAFSPAPITAMTLTRRSETARETRSGKSRHMSRDMALWRAGLSRMIRAIGPADSRRTVPVLTARSCPLDDLTVTQCGNARGADPDLTQDLVGVGAAIRSRRHHGGG